jgi:hypothetical protein
MSAATAAASRTAAPPVSVRRKSRSGVWMLRDQAVSPENGAVRPLESPSLLVALHLHGCRLFSAGQVATRRSPD